MNSQILVLRFPASETQKPLVCLLSKDFDLIFNILHAQIFPRREGIMVLELSGEKDKFKRGIEFLKEQGVDIQKAESEVLRDEDKCVHCGACTAVCPTGALYAQRPEMNIVFDQKKCSICQLCVPTCPTRAMRITSKDENFF